MPYRHRTTKLTHYLDIQVVELWTSCAVVQLIIVKIHIFALVMNLKLRQLEFCLELFQDILAGYSPRKRTLLITSLPVNNLQFTKAKLN